ncbi:hypothetical protein AB0F81_23325 [Actinoplanes sp. NPDC024001]|uniref:hypothetical protein n=1 Tax=Actinoplanes sp. NPDC024001 TaxID=3154598 RepID=UPI0033F4DC01
MRLNPRSRVVLCSYPFAAGALVWSPLVPVGLQAIMPNGAVAPGQVLPPVVPMKVSLLRRAGGMLSISSGPFDREV